ncbi:MAG: chitobiase/beta-hexosaminidase C-terminal domain-containing protein, partial [Spirochaetales bacterium]|nr:chitobiase/beta-hexosaminidase C-terminal domain-containing protein [Spirochaetales bacterium]
MKHNIRRFIAGIAMMVMLLASCQISGVNNAVTDTVESSIESKYGNIEIILPDTGRSWTPAEYKVTAERAGEEPVVKRTTATTLTMRLKVGEWTFSAEAFDENGQLIFKAAGQNSTVRETASNVNLILDKQSSSVKYSFDTSDLLKTTYPLNKIKLTATSTKTGWSDTKTEEITSIDQTLTLKNLLASASYNITVEGYIGTEKYAEKTVTLAAINDISSTYIVSEPIMLEQKKVTPVTSTSSDGASFNNTSTAIELNCATNGAVIYYTKDGSDPTTSSQQYSAGVLLFSGMTGAGSKTLKAIAVKNGMTSSKVFSATYQYNPSEASTPSFSVTGGVLSGTAYNDDIAVTLINNEATGTVQYKIDDGDWQTYSTPIEIIGSSAADVTKTISAKVVGVSDKLDSSEVTQTYTVSYPQLAGVVFNPADGTCDTDSLITLTASVAGANIYYTTDGSTPQAIAANKYNAPFKLTVGTQIVKAFAVKAKYKNSAVKEATYIVTAAEQTGGIELTLAKKLTLVNGVWEIENASDSNFAVGKVVFGPAHFEPSTEYTLTYSAGLQAAISIIKNSVDTIVQSIPASNAVTFTTDGATTSADNYYFIFEVTEAMNNVQLSIYPTGNAPTPVTGVAITPNSAADLAMTVGDVKTF